MVQMSKGSLPAISFDRHGPPMPVSPIILSVPHAGREYPAAMLSALRLPIDALLSLEDRFIDQVALTARRQETLYVQRPARAWIDLNRSEHERDPKLDDGADRRTMPTESIKLRSGLGLVPRRIADGGDIWRRRLRGDEVDARIANDYRPYHAALSATLAAARARFGIAILLDIHSMPPLGAPDDAARIVFGDRFGRAAASAIVARAEAAADSHGVRHALNTPYSGGHILDRHARPNQGIHAVQVEFDRSLYLDALLDQPGTGLTAAAGLLRSIIDALADESLILRTPIAAE